MLACSFLLLSHASTCCKLSFCISVHWEDTCLVSTSTLPVFLHKWMVYSWALIFTHTLPHAMVVICWPPMPLAGLSCQPRSYLIFESHRLRSEEPSCPRAFPQLSFSLWDLSSLLHMSAVEKTRSNGFKLQHRGLGWNWKYFIRVWTVNNGKGAQEDHKTSPFRILRII